MKAGDAVVVQYGHARLAGTVIGFTPQRVRVEVTLPTGAKSKRTVGRDRIDPPPAEKEH